MSGYDAFLDDWKKFRDEDALWKARASRQLLSIQARQVELEGDVRRLRASRWLSTALRSHASSWVTAFALVGILLAIIAR